MSLWGKSLLSCLSACIMAGIAALAVIVAAMAGNPVLAMALPIALAGGLILFKHPFLGVLALAVFSHLDAVEKMLFGFLPLSAFKAITAATVMIIMLKAATLRDDIFAFMREPITFFAMAFASMSLVSMWFAADMGLAAGSLRRNTSLVLLVFLVATLANTRKRAETLVWALVATSFVSALILLADTALGVTLVSQSEAATTARTSEGFDRSSGGSDYNPTTAASMLLVGVIFTLAHVLETSHRRKLLLGVFLIGMMAVILSFARSAVLATVVVVAILAWRHKHERYLPLAAFCGFLALVMALPFIPVEYWERLTSIFGGGGDWTLGRRMTYNLIGIDLFLQHPVFGVGPGNFVHHFTDPVYRFLPGRTLLGRELHNMYLSVIVQFGIVGAIPFFAMLYYSMQRLRLIYEAPCDDRMQVMALCLRIALIAYLVACLFLPNEYTKYTWLIPAICAALYRANQTERAKTQEEAP